MFFVKKKVINSVEEFTQLPEKSNFRLIEKNLEIPETAPCERKKIKSVVVVAGEKESLWSRRNNNSPLVAWNARQSVARRSRLTRGALLKAIRHARESRRRRDRKTLCFFSSFIPPPPHIYVFVQILSPVAFVFQIRFQKFNQNILL